MQRKVIKLKIPICDTMDFVPTHPVTDQPVQGFTMRLCRPHTRSFAQLAAAVGAVADQVRHDSADMPQEILNRLIAAATAGIMTVSWTGTLIGTSEIPFSVSAATKLAGQNPWLASQILTAIESPSSFERISENQNLTVQ
jgi:hypothetical protein